MNKTQRCLVLGGGGFIGSNLVEGLLKSGYIVRVFDVKNFSKTNILPFLSDLEITEGDFNNQSDVRSALANVDYVFHCITATIPASSVGNPVYDIEANLLPTLNLLNLCLEIRISKFIYLSSGGTVYGAPEFLPINESHPCQPINSYGITKRTIESYIIMFNRLHNFNAAIFRLANPYGKNQNPMSSQGAVSIFCYKSLTNKVVEIWGDGSVVRDYIFIDDVIDVLVRSVQIDTPEVVYNLGTGIGTSIMQLIDLINRESRRLKVVFQNSRSFDVSQNILSTERLFRRFGNLKFTNLNVGVQFVLEYLEKIVKEDVK